MATGNMDSQILVPTPRGRKNKTEGKGGKNRLFPHHYQLASNFLRLMEAFFSGSLGYGDFLRREISTPVKSRSGE